MDKMLKSLSDILKDIVRGLQDYPILLAGLGFSIIFILLIVLGKLPPDWWIVVAFLVLVESFLFAYLFSSTKAKKKHESLPSHEEGNLKSIIESLIDAEILSTRERHHKSAIRKFDGNYWTNLDINFFQLEGNEQILERLANFIVNFYLKNVVGNVVVIDPIEFDADQYAMGVIKRLAVRMGLSVVGKREIKNEDKPIILAPIYSGELQNFINANSADIYLLVILLAPVTHTSSITCKSTLKK